MRLVPVRAAILGVLFAAIVTLPGLGSGTLWDNSETAYGEVAREIGLTHDWVVMHLNGAPWFVQPPLYFWCAALVAQLVGFSEFALRLPSAIATIAMSGALGYATARIAGGRAGTIAAIVLATSLMQAIVGRLAIMDALLDLCIVAAILWWFRALEPLEAGGAAPGKRSTAFLCGSAALAIGTLAKGPVAPVIVVLVIAVWLIWDRRSGVRVVVPPLATLVGAALVFLVLTAPWFIAISLRVGPHAATELIGHYTIGRYTGVIENQRGPWWYYVPVLILGFFPWIAYVPVGIARAFDEARNRDGTLARLALVWTFVPLVFFSFAQTKLPNYVAMVLPALAIVVALWFEHIANGRDRRAAIISTATIPLFIGAVAFAIAAFSRTNALEVGAVIAQLELLGIGMLIGSLLTVAAVAIPRFAARAPYVLAATAGALVLFIAFIAEPAAEPLKPIPHFAHLIDAQNAPHAVLAIRGVAGGNGLIFYSHPGVQPIADDDQSYRALICANDDVFLVTRVKDAPMLIEQAQRAAKHVQTFDNVTRVTLLRITGPHC